VHELCSKPTRSGSLTVADLCDLYLIAEVTGSEPLRDFVEPRLNPLTRLPPEVAPKVAPQPPESPESVKQLAPHEILRLAELYHETADVDRQNTLAAFVFSQYLPQPGLIDAIEPDEWLGLVKLAARSSGVADRQAMVQLVDAALEDGTFKVKRLSASQVNALVKYLDKLASDTAAGTTLSEKICTTWLGVKAIWLQLPAADRASGV